MSRRDSDVGDQHTQDERLDLLLRWCRAVCAHYNLQVRWQSADWMDKGCLHQLNCLVSSTFCFLLNFVQTFLCVNFCKKILMSLDK